jgi:phenylpropionate dioxygenase-like ring-hydroxylating dioxygenase large terminal subunit
MSPPARLPDKRFPFAAFPKGWFQVAYSRDVDDDCVVCPFRGWRFDGTGSHVEIPYAKTVSRTARSRAWPTAERAGIIFVWYSPDSTEPEWELPKILESEDAAFTFHAPDDARWRFRSHPQEVFENTVDIAHFATVHGVSGFGDLELETDGHWLKVRHRGLGRSCTILTVRPIDGDMVDARYTFFVQTDTETGEMSRMGLGFARDFCKQIEQDIPIWESKIYRDRPQLARGEGGITEFRSWAMRSYEETNA